MKSRMKDTLLLIGSGDSDRARLHDIFESSYYLLEAESVEQGIMMLGQNSSCIAAVLADIPLSDTSLLQVLTAACHPGTENEIPVIVIVVPASTGEREELAFLMGAADVVLKPYTTLSIQRRLQVLVDLYSHRWHLEKLVEEQNETIRNANQSVLDTLSAIIEHRNTESGGEIPNTRLKNPLTEYPLLSSMINGILCCSSDSSLSVLQGINTLFPLTGYHGEAILSQFDNSLSALVSEEDRPVLAALLQNPDLHSQTVETEFRIRHKNGSVIWVLCRARAQIGADGRESIYMNLSDITSCKKKQSELEATINRHQIIMEQSESIVFEWDLKQDTIACSEKWHTRFGYDGNPSGFLNRLDHATLFHPDDLPMLREKSKVTAGRSSYGGHGRADRQQSRPLSMEPDPRCNAF